MSEKELWNNVLTFLEKDLSQATIATFFGGTALASLKSGVATISCPNRLSLEHLKLRYGEKIAEALRAAAGGSCTLAFEVQPLTPNKIQELGPIFRTVEQTGLTASYTFENFVIGLSNQLAVSLAQAVVDKPGQLHNPFFIYSGVGLGKTHLLHAVGNRVKEMVPEAKILYSSAEHFTTGVIRELPKEVSRDRCFAD